MMYIDGLDIRLTCGWLFSGFVLGLGWEEGLLHIRVSSLRPNSLDTLAKKSLHPVRSQEAQPTQAMGVRNGHDSWLVK